MLWMEWGVNGRDEVFRRCCEETVRVLRARHQALETILEVFVHDPLCNWALSPTAVLRLQKPDDAEASPAEAVAVVVGVGGAAVTSQQGSTPEASRGNKEAERALQRLKAKLQGLEYGDTLSVEGQVSQLIVEAEDPSRLCQMFPGWAPWL